MAKKYLDENGVLYLWQKIGNVFARKSDYAPLASPVFTGTPMAPTAADGTNNAQIANTAFVKTAIDNALATISTIHFSIVEELPAQGQTGIIYLLPNMHGEGDYYDEYVWIIDSYEKIGTTDIDLSGYMLKTDMEAITNTEIDTIVSD